MKLFKNIEKDFLILGIASNQPKYSRRKLVMTCLIYGLATASSVIFLIFKANTFEEYTNNIFMISCQSMLFINFVLMANRQAKLFKLIENFEKYIDKKSKNPTSKANLTKTSEQIEKWSGIGNFLIVKVAPVSWIFPKAIFSYFLYFTTNLGNDAFELPFLNWFPFQWKNPIGYLFAVTLEYIGAVCFFIFAECILFFGIGCFLFQLSNTNDLKNDLKSINHIAKKERREFLASSHMPDFIEFYSNVKQFIHDFSDIFQPLFVVLFAWSMIAMCGVMLLIQMEMNEHDSIVLIVTIFYATYAFGALFLVCDLCQRLTNAFEEISDEIVAFKWYLFRLEIQKLLPTILIGTQEAVVLDGFGSIAVLRDTFKKIFNKGFSYFMVVREFIK